MHEVGFELTLSLPGSRLKNTGTQGSRRAQEHYKENTIYLENDIVQIKIMPTVAPIYYAAFIKNALRIEKRLVMDQRKHTRYTFDFLIFLFKEGFPDHTPFGDGKVLNLSLHGCKVSSQTNVTLHSTMAVRLYVPTVRPQILVHKARVIWIEEKEFGLKFMNLQQGELQRLAQLMDTLEKNSKDLPPATS